MLEPFVEFEFMRRALYAVLMLSVACAPVGCFLILRRMALVGDAMSHAMLPGAAVGFLVAGLSLPALSLGGFAAALLVAVAAGFVTRQTRQREDTSFAAFYIIALAAGVLLVSIKGSQVDLMHLLFGSVLAVNDVALLQIAIVSSLTCILLVLFYRPLLMDSFDPQFLRTQTPHAWVAHFLLLAMMVANLVSAFQAMGTLMAVGLMMLPAAAARFWSQHMVRLLGISIALAMACATLGLVISYHFELPSGPSIVLLAGAVYVLSVIFGPQGGYLAQHRKPKFHFIR